MLTFNDPFNQKEYLLVTIDTRRASRIPVVDLENAKPEPIGGPILKIWDGGRLYEFNSDLSAASPLNAGIAASGVSRQHQGE